MTTTIVSQPSNLQRSPTSFLGEIELEACRMRFEGYASREIEAGLTQRYGDRAPRDKTIRSWFARGGRLHDFYQSYTAEEARERQVAARHIFGAHVKNAARTIIQLMMDPNCSPRICLRAAIYIVERELGPTPKTPVLAEREDPASRILERLGIIEKESDSTSL